MGKPSLFLARTPPRRLNSVRCYARIFELEAKHGLDVEPDVTALRTKVARLAAVASDESIRHLAPDLVTAAADARSDQDICGRCYQVRREVADRFIARYRREARYLR